MPLEGRRSQNAVCGEASPGRGLFLPTPRFVGPCRLTPPHSLQKHKQDNVASLGVPVCHPNLHLHILKRVESEKNGACGDGPQCVRGDLT